MPPGGLPQHHGDIRHGDGSFPVTVYGSPNQAMSFTDSSPGTGAKYYWVTAENATGADSSPEGPVSVTI